ncbi:MAG: glycosyltransferase family 39 protein, partial [Candidatus Hydrogenedentes bacterium]|nr:glycosyltransferase family 39 protein [Candidatus Hydrogenedentota bacterium]
MQYKKISLTSLFLPILMVLGLVLRIYGIHAESAWWDEYASLTFLDAPTLAQFLQQNRTLDPATLPLYFVLEYLWAHSISSSLAGLRLLSVGIGVATIPLVYALGARLFGKRAGYTAALLLALSPIHIHHSQGIRMYGLLVLLSVASMWSLLRMVQKGKRSGWWLHGLFSLLLYWTHPFALLVPAAQGGWLLLHRRLYRAMLPGWIMMHAMLALPVVGYILSIRFWPQETTGSWLEKPGLGTVIADLFFDDIISFHWQLRLGDIGIKLGVLRQLGDLAFAFVIIVCLAYVVFVWVQKSGTSTSRNISLLLCWLILPPLALFCISLLWRPCIFPRYTAHCSVALYLLAGGMVQQLRNREWRWSVYWILGFLMLFQGIVTLPGPQRTDWQSAAKHISENV